MPWRRDGKDELPRQTQTRSSLTLEVPQRRALYFNQEQRIFLKYPFHKYMNIWGGGMPWTQTAVFGCWFLHSLKLKSVTLRSTDRSRRDRAKKSLPLKDFMVFVGEKSIG